MSKYEILKWLYLKVEAKLKEEHLRIHHNDIKCENCKEWFSISGVKYEHDNNYDDVKDYFVCTCGQCNHTSYWSPSIAPFLVRVDFEGNVKNDK